MNWSIRTRLTAWYSAVTITVLGAGVLAFISVQARLGVERLDGELERLFLTLEGVMRTEFGEGLTLQGAADEASVKSSPRTERYCSQNQRVACSRSGADRWPPRGNRGATHRSSLQSR